MRKIFYCLKIVFAALFFCFPLHISAQVGYIKIGSKVLNDGDTFYICKNSCIVYQSFPTVPSGILWRFKNASIPGTSGNTTPSICYNNTGIDSTVKIVNTPTGLDSISIIIKVSDIYPSSGFTSIQSGNCGNDTVRFTTLNPATGLSYNWLFGDGGTSNLTHPSHQFLSAIGTSGTTTYTVTQTVTNALGCSSTSTDDITVRNIPDASLSTGNASSDVQFVANFNGLPTFKRCTPTGATFNFIFLNQSTTTAINTLYDIDWGDGSAPTQLNASWIIGSSVTHTYARGNYFLTLRVTGSTGCIGIKKYLIFFGLAPGGGITGVEENDTCVRGPLKFPVFGTTNNSPATIYTFQVNDGSDPIIFPHPPQDTIIHYTTISSCGFECQGILNSFCASLTIRNACSVNPTPVSVGNLLVSGNPRARMRLGVSNANIACIGNNISVQNISLFGQVSTGDCSNSGVQVWVISPATGYTTAPSNLGSLNGQPANGSAWTNGAANFTINFTTPGTYTIKLYISNLRCGMDSISRVICVRNPPQAFFTMDRKTSCGPGSANFINNSGVGACNGDVYKWNINFDDPLNCSNNYTPAFEFINSSDTSASPQIKFNKPGRFIITLTTTARDALPGCQPMNSAPDTFIVKGPPKLTLTPPGTICVGDNITPVAVATPCYSNGPLSCSWTFPGGNIITSSNCIPGPITYNNTNNYPISITVTDASCGLDTTATDTLHVINAPQANAGPDTAFCSGDTLRIGPAPQTGVTYQWSPSTGLSNPNMANPFISLTYNGPNDTDTLLYTLEVSGGPGCKGKDTVRIIVKRKPAVGVTPHSLTLCKDSSITLTASGADTYLWSPGGATASSITVSPPVTTTYIVTGTLAATGCKANDTAVITVTNKARAEFSLTDSVYCVDLNLDTAVRVTSYPALNQLYTWYINGVVNNPNITGAPPDTLITTSGAFFNVKLVTTSVAGCAPDSLERTFRTRISSVADFLLQYTDSCGPLTVAFNNLTAPRSTDAQYSWDFGNGRFSNQETPVPEIYPASPSFNDTTYYITLKVFDGCDTTLHRDSVKVYAKPKARFGVNATTLCSNTPLVVNNTSLGTAIKYYWNFGNGMLDTTYSLSEPTGTTYNTPVITTYTVTLIAENSCGRDTQVLAIIVTPITIQPQVQVSGPSQFGCAPPAHTAVFNNSSAGPAFLVWNYGDGSPRDTTTNAQASILHNYNLPGTYTVSVQLYNNCSDTTISLQVLVYPKPVASFTLNRNIICPGETISVNSTSVSTNAIEWLWGDGSTSAGNTATHTYTTAGTFNIRLVAKRLNNFGLVCTDTSAPQSVIVQPNIPAVIRMDTLQPLCAPYTFNATAIGAANASVVQWTFYDTATAPGVFITNGVTASYNFLSPGTYVIKLFTQNSAGCKDSVLKTITVYPVPIAFFNDRPLSTCAADTLVRYTAGYTYPWSDPLSLRWFVNGQPVGVGNILNYHFRLPPGASRPYTFTIKLLPQNVAGCGDSIAGTTLTIKPVPKPGIRVLPGYVLQYPDHQFSFSDTFPASPNFTYQWDMGDRSPFRTIRSFNHEFRDTGTYLVRLKVTDFPTKCTGSDSAQVTILYVSGYLYVPNAFTPGTGPQENRIFKPKGYGLYSYRLKVFDGHGTLLFQTEKIDADGVPTEGWDGTYKGRTMPQDTYIWVIENAVFRNRSPWQGMDYYNGKRPKTNGTLTLIR